jgi:hypothetical protein
MLVIASVPDKPFAVIAHAPVGSDGAVKADAVAGPTLSANTQLSANTSWSSRRQLAPA